MTLSGFESDDNNSTSSTESDNNNDFINFVISLSPDFKIESLINSSDEEEREFVTL